MKSVFTRCPDDLRPASADEITQSIAHALRYEGRKRVHHVDDIMARITAERLLHHLEQAGYVHPETPARGPPPSNSRHRPEWTGYVELQVTSNYAFLRGASHPEELFAQGPRCSAMPHSRSPIPARSPASCAPWEGRQDHRDPPDRRLPARSRRRQQALLVYPTDRPGLFPPLPPADPRQGPRPAKGGCTLGLARSLAAHGEGLLAILLPDQPRPRARRAPRPPAA